MSGYYVEREELMSLFDDEQYRLKKARKARVRHVEKAIRLRAPWVLLRHHKEPPTAHLVVAAADVDPGMQRALNRDGTPRAIPRCQPKKMYAVLTTEDRPLAPVCPKCLDYATKQRMTVEVIER